MTCPITFTVKCFKQYKTKYFLISFDTYYLLTLLWPSDLEVLDPTSSWRHFRPLDFVFWALQIYKDLIEYSPVHLSAISFFWIHTILHDISWFDTIITWYLQYFMTHDLSKSCQKIVRNAWYAWIIHVGTCWMHQMHISSNKYANSC